MSEFDLNETLKAAKVPERPEEYWQEFPHRMGRQLGRASEREQFEPVATRWPLRIGWALAAAALILVVGFMIGQWRGRMETASADGVLQSLKLVRETMTMFPNRIRAIVQDERGLSLVLAEGDDVPASPPLYIQVCDGKKCSSLVTFSGQEVRLAGQNVMVLSDAQGGVILVGERFLWSSEQPRQVAGGLRIQARELGDNKTG
jgi:hypothetical protein